MLDSRVLETAIGLIFVFLSLSLIVTAIQEFVAAALKLRALTLLSGLKTMISDGEKGADFYRALIRSPIVAPSSTRPSYISSQQFSTAVIHILGGAGALPSALPSLRIAAQNLPDSPFKMVLVSTFREGENDLAQFESRLQHWFDQGMNRVSGLYKRISQYLSLALGAALAFTFQVNAIGIGLALWNEPPLRGAIANAASGSAGTGEPSVGQAVQSLAQLHLVPVWVQSPSGTLIWFAGCAITATAVSVGAPFWFDLLQKFVNLRGTGAVPAAKSG